MIGKNLITVLIVVAVLAVAFFGYQHFTKSKDLEEHHKDTYSRLTEAANKSPRAGMVQMGRAINKYFIENKSYPTNLGELYPKYIADQSFINNVNWNYRPLGGNFQLSKSVVSKDRTLVASVDKSLSVRMGTTTVAMVDKTETAEPVVEKPIQIAGLDTGTAGENVAADTPAHSLSPSGLPPIAEGPVEEIERAKAPNNAIRQQQKTRDEVVVAETEAPSDMVSELSNTYLVWKDADGYLGFGNVQYPIIDGLSIATPYNWFNIKRRLEEESTGWQETMVTAYDADVQEVVSKYSDQYLVWKDKHGDIGIGNTQYPHIDRLSIATPQKWFDVKDLSDDMDSGTAEDIASIDYIDMEAVASKYSDQYLVWKDKNGNIGFGDAGYPDSERIEYVIIDGTWHKFAR
jgi:hypothetical protein